MQKFDFNVSKVAAAFAHFTSEDTEDTGAFDDLINTDEVFFPETDLGKDLQERYHLTPPELALFREFAFKSIDVEGAFAPERPVWGADIDVCAVISHFEELVKIEDIHVFHRMVTEPLETILTADNADLIAILSPLNPSEQELLKSLAITVAEHVDYELA